jgi:hypothetical protein
MLRIRFSWRTLGLSAILTALMALSLQVLADTKVWVNINSGVYHCPGGQYYGNTKKGKYLTESDAVLSGYHPAYGQSCSPQVAEQPRPSARQGIAQTSTASATMVWVNTSSHVYHCPGTRYYGATKKGKYLPETEAIASGNRPAYGAKC